VITRTWTFNDGCNNQTVRTQTITVIDDVAPVPSVTPPAVITIACGESEPVYDITWSDNCSDVTPTAISSISIPDCVDGVYQTISRSWTGTDACGNSTTISQLINIVDETAPVPGFTPPTVLNLSCGDDVPAYFIGWSDNCSDVDSTQASSISLQECVDGVYQTIARSWTGTDACGNSTTLNQTINFIDEEAPEFDSMPADIADITCEDALPVQETLTATDNCSGGAVVTELEPVFEADVCAGYLVTYRWQATDNCGNSEMVTKSFNVLPAEGPSIVCEEGGIITSVDELADLVDSDNPENDVEVMTACSLGYEVTVDEFVDGDECGGAIYVFTYTVTDDCGRTATCSRTFILGGSELNVTCPEDATVECVSDIDPQEGDVVVDNGVGIVIAIGDLELVSGTDGCNGAIYSVTYFISDECQRTATCTRIYTLENEGPSITAPADAIVTCFDEVVAGDASVEVACELGYEVSAGDPVLVSGEGSCDGAVYSITYTVEDACGRTAEATQTFTIDNEGLVLTSGPADQTVSCYGDISPMPWGLIYSAPCSTDVFIQITPPNEICCEANCPGAEYEMVYTLTDACGGYAQYIQTFTIDNDGPVITSCGPNEDVTSPDEIEVSEDDVIFEVSCGIEADITISEPEVVDNGCEGTQYIYTYTVTDECGRFDTCTRTFTVPNLSPECQETSDCEDYRYFIADSPVGATSSDIYGAVIEGGVANLTYLTTVNYQAHIGFNETTKELYIVNRNNGSFETYDVSTSVITGPTALSVAVTNIASAAVSMAGELIIGDETTNVIYTVDVLTGTTSPLAGEMISDVFGGDLTYAFDGNLYYASRLNGGELLDVYTDGVVGNMPENVTGVALASDGNLMTSSRSFDELRLYGTLGSANALAIYPTFEGGLPITVKPTDIASGCLDSEPVEEGCYPDVVLAFNQGPQTNGQPVVDERSIAAAATGMPDASNAPGGFVSLGVGGSITLGFPGIVNDGPGNDILIYETSFSGDVCGLGDDETADIELSQNGTDFVLVGSICRDGGVDIAGSGLDYVTAIRITNNIGTGTLDGYDVDGVVAVYDCGPIPEITGGDCYASEVFEYEPGTTLGGAMIEASRTDGNNALGEPEGTDGIVFATLGYGDGENDGFIVVGFNGIVINGPGYDIEVVETSFGNPGCAAYPEYADVSVSEDGIDFYFAGTICKGENQVDISDAELLAGQTLDVTHVKIANRSDLSSTPDGFDVDGVIAIYNCEGIIEGPALAINNGSEAQADRQQGTLVSHPNPTRGNSVVTFSPAYTGYTTVEVFDMSGRSIAVIFSQVADGGTQYRVDFNGVSLPNGVYIYRMTTIDETIIEKFMIAK
jgi:hypothetical protein